MSDRAADRAPAGDGPLRGVRVAVTRPVDQAQALVALLEATGADVVVVPLIEIVDVDGGELAGAVADLGPHDWIVVASPNGANRVAPLLPGVTARRAAVGATTAATLGRVDLVPARQSAEGLLDEFPMADAGGRVVVVQSAEDLLVWPDVQSGEVEEGDQVAVADVEEEVRRPGVVAVLDQLGQRELEQALIEPDGLLDVAGQ